MQNIHVSLNDHEYAAAKAFGAPLLLTVEEVLWTSFDQLMRTANRDEPESQMDYLSSILERRIKAIEPGSLNGTELEP